MPKLSLLNKIFIGYAALVALILIGFIPRPVIIPAAVLLIVYMLWARLEDAAMFFLRSIPLFIAIPLTTSYDNLNLWRPLALVLFARMIWEYRDQIGRELKSFVSAPAPWLKSHPVTRRLAVLLILAAASLVGATYPITGAVRIIYFVNLSMVPAVIYGLIRQGKLTTERVIDNIAVPTIIVIAVGYLQLISTYLMDVYQFMRLWGEGVQLRHYGQEWSHIAVWVGNTWLAYYGSQLSLRVFSLFPDSHSFPTFVLLGLPALFAISLDKIASQSGHITRWWELVRTRARLSVLLVPVAYLIAILSGTRGIWAAFLGVAVLALSLAWLFKRLDIDATRRRVFSYLSAYLLLFFILFAVAWPIFTSPQFLIGKADLGLLGSRIKSVIDFGETSNSLRLQIWKASLRSIAQHPFLGVGIGNFPVVLDQDIRLARAGSTAHNLYLHVAAEMGVFAALEMIILLASAWWGSVRWFRSSSGMPLIYSGVMILSLPWVLAYVMTDPIIFDERVFLLFAASLALIWANNE